jgi:malonyl-CoA decarboxylase
MDEVTPGIDPAARASWFDRLRRGWRDITISIGAPLGLAQTDLVADTDTLRARMNECLNQKGGEVSARARAALLGRSYLGLDDEGKGRFLRLLADEFGTDPATIDRAMAAVKAATKKADRLRAEQRLRDVLESPRIRLLAQFNTLPEGVKFLVDLRAEILDQAKSDASMAALEAEIKDLLAGWFDIGFLELRQVTWRSPALVLEKIASYEAVHAIQSWQDLKNRLDSDRRFYAFFHPRMPDEPLIFVEVALVKGIADNIQTLLDQTAPVDDPAKADTAIFYSISNTQRGLAGISFGGFLIKRVVDSLSREFPNLRNYATLSPMPGFRAWLDGKGGGASLLSGTEERQLAPVASALGAEPDLKSILAKPWHKDDAAAQTLKPILMRLAARYLSDVTAQGRALDPVAHFHLTNGARLERIDWLADISAKGLAQSAGMMVNYLYRLPDIEANHEAYGGNGKIVTSSAIKSLAKG